LTIIKFSKQFSKKLFQLDEKRYWRNIDVWKIAANAANIIENQNYF
jgi:hypothetical protein